VVQGPALAVAVDRAIAPDGTTHPLYLHTSPEFACKKLLAAGEPRLFTAVSAARRRSAAQSCIRLS
jgi:lysyl-tRNA synthetase class 2